MRYVIITILSIIIFFMMAGIVVLLNNTLISKPLFYSAAVLVGVASIPLSGRYWHRVTGTANRWINSIVNILAVGIVAGFTFVAVNYFCAGEPREIDGVIARRYQETRYQSRRVSRRTYVRGHPYQVYFLEVDIPDWGNRSFEVARSKYNHYRKGDSISLTESRGGLGLRVIKL